MRTPPPPAPEGASSEGEPHSPMGQISGASSSEDLRAPLAFSPKRSPRQQQHLRQQQRQQQQREFRQWASMSIDRTHMPRPRQNGGSARLPPTSSPMSPEDGRDDGGGGGSGRGKQQQQQPPSDPSACFMSDPSVSEEELTEIGSSRMDHQKKLLYRQRMREFDARSIGDTSLSSSNISPTPQRFKIQFEGPSPSDQIRSGIGRMKSRIRAAARLSFTSMMNGSETSSDGRTNGDDTGGGRGHSSSDGGTTNGGSDEMLRAALMPPSLSSAASGTPPTPPRSSPRTESSSGEGASDGGARPVRLGVGRGPPDALLAEVPPLPDLRGGREEEPGEGEAEGGSLSSSDSVRGISIAQEHHHVAVADAGAASTSREQPGGEPSSSALRCPGDDAQGGPRDARREGLPPPRRGSPPGGRAPHPPPSRPEPSGPGGGKPTGRKRASPNRGGHRRMRSGDAVAATMNLGREDWIGMELDGIRRPEEADDDDGSSARPATPIAGVGAGRDSPGSAPGVVGRKARGWTDYAPPTQLVHRGGTTSRHSRSMSSAMPAAWDIYGTGGGAPSSRSHMRSASSSVPMPPASAAEWDGSSPPLFARGAPGSTAGPRHSRSPSAAAPMAPVAAWDAVSQGRLAAAWDGYSADASADMRTRPRGVRRMPPPGVGTAGGAHHEFVQRINSELSGDTFDFSDSAAGGSIIMRPLASGSGSESFEEAVLCDDERLCRASSFDPPPAVPWEGAGGGHTRFASHVPPSAAAAAGAGPGHRSHASWLSAYDRGRVVAGSDGSASSSSSGSDATDQTSSSFTDNSGKRARRGGRGKGGPRRSVRFQNPGGKEGTKFDKLMRRVESVLDKPLYRLGDGVENVDETKKPHMFYCPNCKTYQRDFITVATAAEMPAQSYIVLYFGIYLVISLCVFGLQEGWTPLDCAYFSVITLTTAGLGDFVPSSSQGKIVCACFIYVGVATIGLLLGNLLAMSMDKNRLTAARQAQIEDCPNCQRLEKLRRRSVASMSNVNANCAASRSDLGDGFQELKQSLSYTASEGSDCEEGGTIGLDLFEAVNETATAVGKDLRSSNQSIHTRHMSIDIGGRLFGATKPSLLRRSGSSDGLPPAIDEGTPFLGAASRPTADGGDTTANSQEVKSDDAYSTSSSSTESSYVNPNRPMTRVKAAKEVIQTLNRALAHSLFIIAAGSFGFYYIEHMSVVDSFYFTTVLLTSVGYGDIVPVTTAGKIFATTFVLIAGTHLLRCMSSIAMIPLDLRRRRIEQQVLSQFGDQLTDDELQELSTGRLISRLKLATNRPYGQEECTREMFSLAMLVRLGKITEKDVKATFTAFRRLDHGNHGKLNSRSIIEGEIMRQKSLKNLVALSPPDCDWEQGPELPHDCSGVNSSQGQMTPVFSVEYGSMHSPNPFMNPVGGSTGSFRRNYSIDSSFYSREVVSHASSFDFEAYEGWASSFCHYDPPSRIGNSAPNRIDE